MKIIKNLTWVAVAATLLHPASVSRADDKGPLRLSFEKCAVGDGSLAGPVAGDCGPGTVVFTYLSVEPGEAIWHFSGEYTVAATDCSFKAVCTGIVDVRSGHIVLNGSVVSEGPHLGARVHVRAQANADLTCSSGTMTVTPSPPGDETVPYKSKVSGHLTFTPSGGFAIAETGIGTHLGRFTLVGETDANGIFWFTLTVASGDQVFGVLADAAPDLAWVELVVSGGTGRFEGATGNITGIVTMNWLTLNYTAVGSGSITTVGSNKK